MYRLFCFFFVIAVASAGKMKFKDCGSNNLQEVRIDKCNGDQCVFYKGDTVNIEVDFTSNQDTKTAIIDITAKVGEADVKIPNIETNACEKGRLPCPLIKNTKYTLKYSWTFNKTLPPTTILTVRLTSDNNVIACGKIQAEVKEKS